MLKKACLLLATTVLILSAAAGCGGGKMAQDGDTVKVHYTGTLADGSQFDSSEGRAPLEFTLGQGQLIPGFEKAVLGMTTGQKKTVTLPAAEAYGPHIAEMVIEVPQDDLPEGLEPQVGQQLQMTLESGRVTSVMVVSISEDTITIDANHPLAGKDLTFEIELVEVAN